MVTGPNQGLWSGGKKKKRALSVVWCTGRYLALGRVLGPPAGKSAKVLVPSERVVCASRRFVCSSYQTPVADSQP